MSSDVGTSLEDFEDIAAIRASAHRAAQQLTSVLQNYREQHPALHGLIDLITAIVPPMQIAAAEFGAALPAARYLSQDEDLTMMDHMALSNLMEMVVMTQDIAAILHLGAAQMEKVYQMHDPESLGVSDE